MGLPLAVEFARPGSCLRNGATLRRRVIGFDVNEARLAAADVFVVTVPTLIDNAKRPDPSPPERASAKVGRALRARRERLGEEATLPLVIYESKEYQGATEEVCEPILERE